MPNFSSGVILFFFCSFLFASGIPTLGLQEEKKGEWQKAISIYTDALLHDEQNVALWLRVAVLEYKMKNIPLALDAYLHASRIDMNNPFIHQRLSELYVALNQPKEALQEIQKAVLLVPNNPNYLLSQAQLANWNKVLELALESYQRLLIIRKKGDPNFDASELLTQIAQLQSQLHHYEAAIVALNDLIRIKPSAISYQALSQNYAAINKPNEALMEINNALAIEPNNVEFLNTKAKLAEWLKNNKLAVATYQKVLTLLPNQQKNQPQTERIKQTIQLLTSPPVSQIPSIPLNRSTPLNFAIPLSPFQQLINQANNEALAHHYNKAAQAMQKAIQLKPNEVSLYKKLSEIYANAKQPVLALNAINQALQKKPNDIAYLRARAKLAAWANDKAQMQDSYERILKLQPDDQDALLNIAFTYAWRGYTDQSLSAYKYYVKHYPKDPQGWIQYAEPLSWVEDYRRSLYALDQYQKLQGTSDDEYLRVKARVFSLIGYFRSARKINEPLLAKNPTKPYLLSTQTTLLLKSLQTKKGIATLNTLQQKHPDYFELKGLEEVIFTPLRSNINLGSNYTWASDTTRVMQIPTVVGQYFLSPSTSLLVQGDYERAVAASGSGLNTIDGQDSIFDESLMMGFATQIPAVANLRGLLGDLKIQGKNNHLIYDALVNTNLNEKAQFTVESSYNLYRPYLIPQSPRLISLQIMESRIAGFLQWQPFTQDYLNLLVSYSTLTDANDYWHINAWPKTHIFGSQKWQIKLGVDSDIWKYRKRLSDGYYSPLLFQGYEGTIEAYYAVANNIGCSFSGGFGMQKDEKFPHFFYEEDLAAQLFWGIFTDWELRVSGGYTLRMNPLGSYRSWGSNVILTRRF